MTAMRSLETVTKRSSRDRKFCRLLNSPLNVNENGIAVKPPLATVTLPGGPEGAPVVCVGVLLEPPPTEIRPKSTSLRLAAASSCTSSERTSSSAGIALPSRTTVA